MFKNILAILLFLPFCLFSQSEKEIDSLIFREAKKLRNDAKYEAIIPLGKKIIQQSKAINYTRGEAWGYCRLGNAYCSLGKFKESLSSLDKAHQLSKSVDDYSLKASIAIETGRNYNESKLSEKQAIDQFIAAEGFAKKISDKYDRDGYLIYAYQSLLSAYSNMNRNDLAITYAWKSKKIEEDAYILSFITYYHIKENKNKDSIVYYLNRSTAFLDKHPTNTFEKAILYNQWGKYHEDHKNYKQAVNSYKQAEKYGKESKAMDELLKSFYGLSHSYEKLNNYEKTIKYERKFSKLQDSITKANNENVHNSVDHIVKHKEEIHADKESVLKWIIIIALILVGIVVLFLIIYRKENHKKTKLLTEKENVLYQKEEETQELKLKVNESFDEVIQLAKTNSPEFWGRFQEVYPNFRNQILSLNPELKPSELILCAYIYLGFTTKDIADYTFKAVKTIKNNKYNLRKRLSIPTENDFTIWMRDFIK